MVGVGVGTGALGSVIGKLATLLGDEYKMLKRVRKDIAFLERELRRMQILVNVLADMEGLDEVAKDWKASMREISYDMEECINRFMLRLGNGDAKPGFRKKTVRRLKTLFERHGIGTQIKELKARVAEEDERRQRLNLDNYAPATNVAIDPRLAAFHRVAIDGPRDQITSWLTEESVDLKLVAIAGGGGLGKTTLAIETYRTIGEQFQCRASVSVSGTLDPDKFLEDILSQIDEAASSKYQLERWKKDELIREIQRILTGKSLITLYIYIYMYFFVIDDVWKEQHWEFVKAVFRDNYNGSRIIVTTHITKVAKSCCSNSGDQLYQMPHLNFVDSRRLFYKRILNSQHSCPPQLEDVLATILRKCGGVTLAILTVASLLSHKPQNPTEWERLQDSIGTGLSYESDDDGKCMKHILLLSYWDLPNHLKTCLLYLSEGFIATKQGNSYQEAESCFNELVNRSMIQIVDVDSFEETYCQVHDMVLDLIISQSAEETFATVLDGVCNSLPTKIPKGAIQAITRSKLHVRSLNVFGQTKEIPALVDCLSLRVFDISRGYLSWENKHIRNIGSFHQLRYLRMDGVWITELPADIGKLQNLETMDLRGNYCFNFKLPSTIAHLQKLVRLFIGNRHFVFSADMFGSMRALEEVSDICKVDNPEKFLEELGHLTKLRKLSMSQLFWSEDFECYRERLGSSLNKLGKYSLDVPKGMASLTNILKLEIAVRTFDEEGLHILMGMPSLAYLLLGVIFSCPLTVSSNGFKLLEVFHYDIVTGEVRIEFAAGAMPALRRLHLFWHAQHRVRRSAMLEENAQEQREDHVI
ncbi:hypothetical protein VPH35_140806 [Triticum aestivum]